MLFNSHLIAWHLHCINKFFHPLLEIAGKKIKTRPLFTPETNKFIPHSRNSWCLSDNCLRKAVAFLRALFFFTWIGFLPWLWVSIRSNEPPSSELRSASLFLLECVQHIYLFCVSQPFPFQRKVCVTKSMQALYLNCCWSKESNSMAIQLFISLSICLLSILEMTTRKEMWL